MAANPTTSNAWYKLTPDIHGSYVNATWTTVAPMADTRLFFASQVLQDGRLFVAGAEYGTGVATAELYDPQFNTWTYINPPTTLLDPTQPAAPPFTTNQGFVDADSILLSNGKILLAPVEQRTSGQALLYDPPSNSWSSAASALYFNQNEATWVKLPDDSILTVDTGQTSSERYLPAFDQWIVDKTVPVSLYDGIGSEIGPALLLPDERAFFLGASGSTAFYTPGMPNLPGAWAAGPVIPNVIQYPVDNNGNQQTGSAFTTAGAPPDAPAAMMRSGRVLCAFSGKLYNDARAGTTVSTYWNAQTNPQYPQPTSFFEYNPATNAFIQISSPTAPRTANSTDNIPAYKSAMLDLPDGGVLYAHQGTDVYYYLPAEAPIAGKPAISDFATNANGSYHLTGTGFNGLSQGASYGDDLQMDTNYPIVRVTADNGDVFYARTFSWSSTSVATKNASVSTEFWLNGRPAEGGGALYSLVVIANGIASDPVVFPGPVWIDFFYTGSPQLGTIAAPYATLSEGIAAVSPHGTVVLQGARTTNERLTPLSKPVTIISAGGTVTIGQ